MRHRVSATVAATLTLTCILTPSRAGSIYTLRTPPTQFGPFVTIDFANPPATPPAIGGWTANGRVIDSITVEFYPKEYFIDAQATSVVSLNGSRLDGGTILADFAPDPIHTVGHLFLTFSPVAGQSMMIFATAVGTGESGSGDFLFVGTTWPAPLPEPGEQLMLSLGLAAVAGMAWRRRLID